MKYLNHRLWNLSEKQTLSYEPAGVSKVLLAGVLLAVGSLVVPWQSQAQTTIAHWSFDSSSLSSDGSGNIIGAADSTGNHGATVGTVGSFVSATFAGSDSVSGAFGQGLLFNGDNFMVFPELTELMAGNGAPSYTVSYWINTTSVSSATPYEAMSDWGNASASTGTSKYAYCFGPGGATSMVSQTRYGTGNGTTIFGRTAATPAAVNDGSWHMLTWTFDTTSGVLDSYFDGALADSYTSTAGSFQMANAASSVGDFGLKGDNGYMLPAGTELDEVWVYQGVLDQNQITGLFTANDINAVPEPGTMAFMGLGGIFLGLMRVRRHA